MREVQQRLEPPTWRNAAAAATGEPTAHLSHPWRNKRGQRNAIYPEPKRNAPGGGERVGAVLARGDAHDGGAVKCSHRRGLGSLLGVARAQLPKAVGAPHEQSAVRPQRQRMRVPHLHLHYNQKQCVQCGLC